MDGFVEEAFASAFWGLAVAGILFDIGDEPGIENALAIVGRIKATIKIEIGPAEIQPDLFASIPILSMTAAAFTIFATALARQCW